MNLIKKIKEVKTLEKKQPKLDETKKNAQKLAKATRTRTTQARKLNNLAGRTYKGQAQNYLLPAGGSTSSTVKAREKARMAKEAATKKASANKTQVTKLKKEIKVSTDKMKPRAKAAGILGGALLAGQVGKDALGALAKLPPIKDKLTAAERRAVNVKASKAKSKADIKVNANKARKKVVEKRQYKAKQR